MITGKNSAIKGFGLFFYAIITILVLIGCCISTVSPIFIIAAILNFVANGYAIYKLYRTYSEK